MDDHLARAAWSAIGRANALELLGLESLVAARLRSLGHPALCTVSGTSSCADDVAENLTAHTQVYSAGCPGLFALSKRIGQPIVKIGTTTRADAMERIADLTWTEYGGYDLSAARAKAGFADYKKIEFRLEPGTLPTGVRLAKGVFQIDLPTGWSGPDFEKALRRMLMPYSTGRWARSERGLIALKRVGMVPGDLQFHTKSGSRVCDTSEFYLLSPARQGNAVLGLIMKAMTEEQS